MRAFAPVLLVLCVVGTPARAVDLSQVDRQVAKEPKYQGQPGYCLLVFGPEAKKRIWLALDGDKLYVDRRGQGDLTGQQTTLNTSKMVTIDLPEVPDASNQPQTGRLTVRRHASDGVQLYFHLPGQPNQLAGTPSQSIPLASQPKDAPIVHFNGPLTFQAEATPDTRSPGQFIVGGRLGTPGLGKNTFCVVASRDLPPGLKLVVRAAFPAKEADRQEIEKEFVLGSPSPCGFHQFTATVIAPAEAGLGMVRLTLLGEGWKDRPIQSVSLERAR